MINRIICESLETECVSFGVWFGWILIIVEGSSEINGTSSEDCRCHISHMLLNHLLWNWHCTTKLWKKIIFYGKYIHSLVILSRYSQRNLLLSSTRFTKTHTHTHISHTLVRKNKFSILPIGTPADPFIVYSYYSTAAVREKKKTQQQQLTRRPNKNSKTKSTYDNVI